MLEATGADRVARVLDLTSINYSSNAGEVLAVLLRAAGLEWSDDGQRLWRAADLGTALKWCTPAAANSRRPSERVRGWLAGWPRSTRPPAPPRRTMQTWRGRAAPPRSALLPPPAPLSRWGSSSSRPSGAMCCRAAQAGAPCRAPSLPP